MWHWWRDNTVPMLRLGQCDAAFSFYVLSQVLLIYIDSIGQSGGGWWQDSACSPQLCIYPNNCLWASFPFQPSTCLESKHQYHTIYVTARQVLTLEKLCLFNLLFRNLHKHLFVCKILYILNMSYYCYCLMKNEDVVRMSKM